MQPRYLSQSGGNANWTKGFTDAAFNAASGLRDQAEVKDARSQREFQNDRIRKQDAIAAKDRELLSQVNAFSNKDPSTFEYQLSDYGAEQRDAITNAKKSLTAERDATSRFLSTGSAEDLDRAIDVYSKNLTNLDDPLKEQKIAERRNRLLGFGREALDKGYDTDQRTGRIQELVSGLYDPQFSRIDDTIRQGTGLTKEGQFRAFVRQLDPSLTSRFSRGELEQKFDSILTAQSRDEILANEQARVAGLNAAKKEQIELNDKFFKTNSKYVGSYKGKRSPKDVFTAYEKIAGLDIGMFDTPQAVNQLTFILDNNPEIDPMAAAAAVYKNINRGGVEDSEGSDILKIEDDARAISGLDTKKRDVDKDGKPVIKTTSSKKETPRLSDYKYTPAQARDLADLLRQRVVLAGGGDYRLGIDDKYLEKVKAAVEKLPEADNKTDKKALEPASTTAAVPAVIEQPQQTAADMVRYNPRGKYRINPNSLESLQASAVESGDRIAELLKDINTNNAKLNDPKSTRFAKNRSASMIDILENKRLDEVENLINLQNRVKALQQL